MVYQGSGIVDGGETRTLALSQGSPAVTREARSGDVKKRGQQV